MLRLVRRAECAVRPSSTTSHGLGRHSSAYASKHHDPLSILFCGADEFSIYSLRALRDVQRRRPEKIASIGVVCKPDKRVGRGLKKIQEVPIKGVANQLGLQSYQIDTFKGWSPPAPIDLVVAVSFGLLVPSRLLNGAKYGGLNVHPSMLPDLRGPAPIIHTLLKRRSYTGVTLQTMHPTRFDHGTVLAQTPLPGVPVPPECIPDELLKVLGLLGAELLCDGVENAVFVPPLIDARQGVPEPEQIEHAPKITPEERHIDWSSWTADEVRLRDKVLGRLWDSETYSRSFANGSQVSPKRITFHGPWTVDNGAETTAAEDPQQLPGQPVLVPGEHPKSLKMGVRTLDRQIVMPTAATIEGDGKGNGLPVLMHGLKAD